jgi:hypothetical protein
MIDFEDVESLERLEYNKTRTVLALAIVGVGVVGVLLLIGDFVSQSGGLE